MLAAAAPAFSPIRSFCTSSISSPAPSLKARGFTELAVHQMERVFGSDENKLHVNMRLHKVAGHMTEILEFHAEQPLLQVLFIPGNPGIVSFYRDYVEAVYELLDRKASVTAIGHIAHTSETWSFNDFVLAKKDKGALLKPHLTLIKWTQTYINDCLHREKSKDWEDGRLFSLQDQISHKIEFVREELLPRDIPIILAGHSIGAYISLDIFKAFPGKVSYMIGMYPFLRMNKESSWQAMLTKSAMSPFVCATLSCLAALIGQSPTWFHKGFVKSLLGCSWSSDAINVACTHLLRYSMVRNFTFMGMTEFKKLQENPDWTFIREKEDQIAFLFGVDDHWGPLSLYEEVSRNAPGVVLAIEKEGHTHAFCCTKAGSDWVASHVVDLIKQHVLKRKIILRNTVDEDSK